MNAKKTPQNKTATHKPSSMEELLNLVHKLPSIKRGDTVPGTIVSLSKKEALFDLGWKTNAILIQPEVKELTTFLPYLSVGQKIDVRIVNIEAKAGFPVVSLQSFFEKGKWDILKQKFDKEELVEVEVMGSGKGGLFVEVMGIRGVIPKIQLTQAYIQDPAPLFGKKINDFPESFQSIINSDIYTSLKKFTRRENEIALFFA